MPFELLGRLTAAVDPAPSPSPTAKVLEDWEVTPGLAGFVATFGVALAAVFLFLSLSRHMRKANAYARANGIEVPERQSIAFRRDEPPAADDGVAGAADDGGAGDTRPPASP